MTGAADEKCACCQQPVQPGEGRRIPIEQGTTVSPDVLVHKQRCIPVNQYGGRGRR